MSIRNGSFPLPARRAVLATVFTLACLAGAVPAKPSEAESTLLVVRASPGETAGIAERNRLTILDRLVDSAGDEIALMRIETPAAGTRVATALVAREPSIKAAEVALYAELPELRPTAELMQSTMALLDALAEEGVVTLGIREDGTPRKIWSGYADQPGARMVRVRQAHLQGIGNGTVIAIVDSGIDLLHPVFADRLLAGWDFLEDRPENASIRSSTDESTMAKLDQSTMAILDRHTRAFVSGSDVEAMAIDDSTTALVAAGVGDALDGRLAPAFGHGTMVAGVAHLVAPGASILPLRAFDDQGRACTFDLIQAIYHAVRNGATVINMSFNLAQRSAELERAIAHAARRGVITVASAGNDGSSTLVYPAALPATIGIAATDLDDFVAPFSNFGSDLVALAAPGVSVITSYPGGGWAAASGTSFSAPWVSGAVALLAEHAARGAVSLELDRVLGALAHSAQVQGPLAFDVGFGRVDVESANQNLGIAPSSETGNVQ
ncbi:MAG TPA: S8 family serine peptidase [Thermoanaerobaculia bacterium]|nr:S8 family serine peptidase [Thermoanaerobaculia bacterium]